MRYVAYIIAREYIYQSVQYPMHARLQYSLSVAALPLELL